jgi:hypothetical protein
MSTSAVNRYRANLQPVRRLIDTVYVPRRIDESLFEAHCSALCAALLDAARRESAVHDDADKRAAVDEEVAQLDALIAQFAEPAIRAVIVGALQTPTSMTTAEWQSQLRSVYSQVPLYEHNRRSDLASFAVAQHPSILADSAAGIDDDDELFGYGATSGQHRWRPELRRDTKVRDRVLTNVCAPDSALLRDQVTLCHFHLQGYCTKGASCTRAHVGPSLATVCSFFVAGSCAKGDACAFVHDASLFPCPSLSDTTHVCVADCPFSHERRLADFYEATQKRRRLAQEMQSQSQHGGGGKL